jgi:hypothetical protein
MTIVWKPSAGVCWRCAFGRSVDSVDKAQCSAIGRPSSAGVKVEFDGHNRGSFLPAPPPLAASDHLDALCVSTHTSTVIGRAKLTRAAR